MAEIHRTFAAEAVDVVANYPKGPAMATVRVNLRGVPMRFTDTGGSGPALVFLHGLFNTADMWRGQLERFSERRRVVTYDLRGHGGSGIDNRPYTMELLAEDLEALMDHLHLGPAVVCGFSAGGCVAQALAVRRPDRFAGLVLSDAIENGLHGPAGAVARGALRLTSLLPRRGIVASTTLATLPMRPDVRRYFQAQALANLRGLPKAKILEISASVLTFRRRDLSDFPAPVAVLVGEREPALMRREAERLARGIPRATLELIRGSQHGPNLENPAAFDAAVEGLLRRI